MAAALAALAALTTLGSAGAVAAAPAGDDPISAAFKGRCRSERGVVLLVSPRRPTVRGPLQVLAVSERPVAGGVLAGKGPEGRLELRPLVRGGPPYWWYARVERPRSGSYRFVLLDAAGKTVACGGALVRDKGFRSGAKPDDEAWWKTGRPWTRVRENIYAAWIEKLFDAPLDQRPTWSPLHAVLHDPARNFLYNYHGADEDGPRRADAVVVKPDCADLPYFLRAYFAWKLRLPFGYRQCSRGSDKRPPRCDELKTNLAAPDTTRASLAGRFSYYLRRRVGYVHSGSGATAADNDETDLYPLALTRSAIRPGTTYIDTAGHLMVIARWVPQRGNTSGQLFVVESQPDLTVGRKRFWRGAMLFTPRPRGRAGGFKAFRPLVLSEGRVVALTNKEIRKSKEYGDYSDEQYRISKDDFYERADRLINPKPLSPAAAYRAQLDALFELIQKRKDSVATGEAYMKKSGYRVMKMPRGAADLPDHRPLGGLRHALTGLPAAGGHRSGAGLPRAGDQAPGSLRPQAGAEARGGGPRARGAAQAPGARAALQLHPQRRQRADADHGPADRTPQGAGDGLQPQRLHRAALAGPGGGAGHVQAARAGRAAPTDGAVPRVVCRANAAAGALIQRARRVTCAPGEFLQGRHLLRLLLG